MTTIEEFNGWLRKPEGCTLEFKAAKNSFNADKDLPDYCAALSNEGGGKLILGVDTKGKVIGTTAFQGTFNKLSHDLLTKIKIRVDVEELYHQDGRVLIFHIPPHPQGIPIKSTGAYTYPMRAGESLTEMDEITLKSILNETTPDFFNQIVDGLSLQSNRQCTNMRYQIYSDGSGHEIFCSVGALSGEKANIDKLRN